MPGGIGFYVHHHGRGHANRAQQIIQHLEEPVTVFGSSLDAVQSSARIEKVVLPMDTVDPSPPHDWPDVLHYAPLEVPGIRERMFRMAQWVRDTNPSLLVVDVSVEVTLLARLLGVPTVVMRQNGLRNDLPHQAAFQSSIGLLAPYSFALEDEGTPSWVQNKTYYAGGFSRYAGRSLRRAEARRQVGMHSDTTYVVVMNGLGGTGNPLEKIKQAALKCPDQQWWVVGPTHPTDETLPVNVRVVGRVDDTFPYLKGADVVVASAGNNTVMEVATAGTPYVCIPEERPFQEQVAKADALRRMRAARVLPTWPATADWPSILQSMTGSDTAALTTLIDPDGAKECARYIKDVSRRDDHA